jgi:hypothetical protein
LVKRSKPPRLGEVSKRALFELVGYHPHPGQILVHRSRARRRVLACGVRWGKSTAGAMEAVAALLEPGPGSIGWTVAPSYDLASQVFQRVVAAVEATFKHRVLHLDPREQRLVVLNLGGGRSELRAKSADHAVSLLGEGLDWLIVDEAARLKREIWESHLAQRLIDKDGWALLLSTPQGVGWFLDLYRRGQRGRDPAFESWRSPSWENPYLERSVIEAERARLALEVFEQEFAAVFLGGEVEPCDACGFPDVHGIYVPVLYEGEKLRRCPECRRLVNDQGKAIVRSDKVVARVVYLHGVKRPAMLPLEADWGKDDDGREG